MSEEEEKKPTIIQIWYEFTTLRRDLEQKIKDLEVTSLSLQYGARTEAEFRQKLREAHVLVEKIERLLGPESKPPTGVT